MLARLWLLFLVAFTLPLPSAQAQRAICGIDLGRDSRCHSELRRLKKACQRQPSICEKSYTATSLPEAKDAEARCLQMWKTKRREWITSLCGVPLYSPPQTFCGLKGVEVAVACTRLALSSAPSASSSSASSGSSSDSSAPGLSSAPSESPGPSPSSPSSESPVPSPSSPRPSLAAPPSPSSSAPPRTFEPSKENKVGLKAALPPGGAASSSEGGLPWWFFLLQAVILGLLGWLVLQRFPSRSPTRQRWAESDAWLSSVPPWQERMPLDAELPGLASDSKLPPYRDLDEKITDLRRELQEYKDAAAQTSALVPTRSPFVQMQEEADALFAYYCGLAHQIVEQTHLHKISPIQKQILQTKDKLQWIFDAHREPEQTASVVYELREEILRTLINLLDATGYMDVDATIRKHLSLGDHLFGAYLSKIEEEQITRYLEGHPLASFREIRGAYLQEIESHLLLQLDSIRQVASLPMSMPLEEQQALFETAFVERFLLGSLPRELQKLHRLSSLDRSGALIEMIADLIDDQIHQAGMLLLPPLPVNSRESIAGRLQHLLQARAIYASTKIPTGESIALPPRALPPEGSKEPSGNEQKGISSQEIPQEMAFPKHHTFDQDIPSLEALDAAFSSLGSPPSQSGKLQLSPQAPRSHVSHVSSPSAALDASASPTANAHERDLEQAFASLLSASPPSTDLDEGSSFPQRLGGLGSTASRPPTDGFQAPPLGHPDSNPPPEEVPPFDLQSRVTTDPETLAPVPSPSPQPSSARRATTDAFEQAHLAHAFERSDAERLSSEPKTATYGSVPPSNERS